MGPDDQVRQPEVAPGSRLYCGDDIGASATKVVLIDDTSEIRARVVRHSGVNYEATAAACLAQALAEAGGAVKQVVRTVSTDYARRSVSFAQASRTEIQCHGVGAYHLVPRAITVVDIGGQDNVWEYSKRIGEAAQIVAQKEGYVAIFDKGNEALVRIVLYHHPGLDVTDLIVKEFDRQSK